MVTIQLSSIIALFINRANITKKIVDEPATCEKHNYDAEFVNKTKAYVNAAVLVLTLA